jgi:hypothetical protein
MAVDHEPGKAENSAGMPFSPDRPRRRRSADSYRLTEEDEPFLGRMSENYAQILREEGPIAEIAARLHIAPGTVKSRRYRARAVLDALRMQARQESSH